MNEVIDQYKVQLKDKYKELSQDEVKKFIYKPVIHIVSTLLYIIYFKKSDTTHKDKLLVDQCEIIKELQNFSGLTEEKFYEEVHHLGKSSLPLSMALQLSYGIYLF